MVNLGIAKLLVEGRSKNRYLHTVSNAFAKFVLEELKQSPTTILQNNFTIQPSEFLDEEQLKLLPNLRNITLFFVKEPDVEGGIYVSGAGYYPEKGEEQYGDTEYEFERGEIDFKILIDENIESFDQLKSMSSMLYSSLSELFRHEIEHYIDDYEIEGGLSSQRKDRSPYYKLTDSQKEQFNYYARPYEIKAFVKQFMEEARRNKKPFHEVLIEYLKTNHEFSTFNTNPKLKDILYLLIYKYLEHGSIIFNSVREDEQAMDYLEKLGRYLDNKGLYMPEETNESFDKNKFKEWLNEASSLSKYWKKRAKSRAKRAGRSRMLKQDYEWAESQQEKSMDLSGVLAKAFEDQIKESEILKKQLEEIIAFEAKKKKFKDPFLDAPTGRGKGFKKKSKKYNRKGESTVAPPEDFGGFGPMTLEEEDEIN